MLRIISACATGPGDPGGKWRRKTGGVGDVKDAWCYLPWLSFIPVRLSGGVRFRIAVCGERRHHALCLPSPARGFFAVARPTRIDETVAGGGIDLNSASQGATFAGLVDGGGEPFRGASGAVHLLY